MRRTGDPEGVSTSVGCRDAALRRARLEQLWKQTTTDRERIARYVEDRGLPPEVLNSVPLGVLRYYPALPYFDPEGKRRGDFPAIVARMTDVGGNGVTLHRTYLSPDGPGKLDLGDGLSAKKLMTAVEDGGTKGASIKLNPVRSVLGLTEGMETALAVMAATGQHVWAAGSAGGLESVELPTEVTQVHVWADRDPSGRGEQAAERAAARFQGESREVFIHVPAGPANKDWLDVYAAEGEEPLLSALAEDAAWSPSKSAPSVGVLLSTVSPEEVEGFWEGRIPLGKLTVIDGDPGTGKSTLTLDLAARASRGGPMPDGGTYRDPVGVVILSGEDGLADTIVPRLLAAGADLMRIIALTECPDAQGEETHPPVLPDDLGVIREAIVRVEAKLLIIDPLMAYLGSDTNSHRDQDIRRVLFQVAALAEETGVAIVVVRHLNKASGGVALYRGGGSIGIIGAARSGLLVAVDPDDEDRRVLASTKSNLGPRPESLSFYLEASDGEPAHVVWDGTSAHDANALLAAPSTGEERLAIDEAQEFLLTVLAEGPVACTQVVTEARGAGLSERTLRRAKAALGIESHKPDMRSPWIWTLPKVAKDCRRWPISEDGHLRTSSASVGHLRPEGQPLMEALI